MDVEAHIITSFMCVHLGLLLTMPARDVFIMAIIFGRTRTKSVDYQAGGKWEELSCEKKVWKSLSFHPGHAHWTLIRNARSTRSKCDGSCVEREHNVCKEVLTNAHMYICQCAWKTKNTTIQGESERMVMCTTVGRLGTIYRSLYNIKFLPFT